MFKIPSLCLLLSSMLVLAACQATVTPVDPNDPEPSATPTPVATATPTPAPTPTAGPTSSPAPTATPGWSTVTITATATTFTTLMTEIRRLEGEGQVTGVVDLGSFSVRLNASAQIISFLQEVARTEYFTFSSLFQANLNLQANFNRVITTGEEFVSFWRQYVSSLDAVPSVDFSTQCVIAVFPGLQPTTGYTTTILSIKRTNKKLTVRYKVQAPTSGVPAYFTPVHIVAVPLSKLRGDFEEVVFEKE